MVYSEILPVKQHGLAYAPCEEGSATHWQIEVGFSGNDGVLTLPCRESAEACMEHFIIPFECGDLSKEALRLAWLNE